MFGFFKKVKNKEVFEPKLSDQAYVVDVRNPQEYASGHVAGAINIPLEQILSHASSLASKNQVFVYCRSGNRSAHAMKILKEQGVTNIVDGGSLESAAMLLNKQITTPQHEITQVQNIQKSKSKTHLEVLIPCDFSPQTEFARIMGEKLGEYTDVKLQFVHVIDLPETVTLDNAGNISTCGEIDRSYVEKLKQDGENKLNDLIKKTKIDSVGYIKFGKLTDELLAFSQSRTIDLIITGTKGLWGLKEKISMTQSQILARKSSIPVLSLMCDRSDLQIKDILFVHDFYEKNVKHLSLMNSLVTAFNGVFHQLYVTDRLNGGEEKELNALMDEYASSHEFDNYKNHIEVADNLEKGVHQFLGHQDADIVFIGTHGKGGVFHHSGAEALIKHLFKPILTFQLD
ncbi:MAG: universal stress protein [Saprospiraceae bacterium]|nr:universal stress protein [Saprospiraceae bacterium]MCB9309802.1 universal stress protein [Lewinellaceae bacterium]